MQYVAVNCQPAENVDDLPCTLTFNKLETERSTDKHFAISNITGHANPKEILAVMGESGSGKTTLLNTIAGRHKLKCGEVNLNGEEIHPSHHRQTIGYVQQQDIFFPTLTLEQTLTYTALLRLPEKFTATEKMLKVKELIKALDLERCKNTQVGPLSGGEKKRLSIASELITNPKVLLIDEPTSGLDSSTAMQLISLLKDFATRQSKTVVITVHQPSSQMFQLFDSLLLLCEGNTAYFGKVNQVIPYFGALGYKIGPNYNPAEFIVEKLKSDKEKILPAYVTASTKSLLPLNSGRNNNNSPDTCSKTKRFKVSEGEISTTNCSWPTSFSTQVKVLYSRNLRLAIPRVLSNVNVVQAVAFAFMAGFVWFRTPRIESSLDDIDGYMFFSAHYWMLFVLFQALWAFPLERPVIMKERQAGSYRLSAYYFAKLLSETPLEIALPCLYQAISYLLMGSTTAAFFGILFSQVLSSLASQSAGLLIGVSFEASTAMTIAAIFTVGAQLLGGYLTKNIPSFLKIMSLVYNGLKNMQIFEYYAGDPILCGSPSDYPSCNVTTLSDQPRYIHPAELLNRENHGFEFPYWSHTLFLVICIVVFRTLCYIILQRTI